ncbi:hypothetical protein GE21DRAFT_1323820 [Neurospora crassa]|nr:hypothetical protein GE21DRAFT_1323820 [Neurospora crassa]
MWIPEVDEMETTGAVGSAVSSSGWITGVGRELGSWMLHSSQFHAKKPRGIHSWERGWRAGRMRENLQIFSLHLAPGLCTTQHSTLIRDTATWKMWLCCGEHPKRKNPEMKDIGSLALEIRKWMRSLCGFRASVDPDHPTDLPGKGKAC